MSGLRPLSDGWASGRLRDMSVYTVALPPDLAERLRELAHQDRRRPRSEAEILLADAIRRAGAGDGSLSALADRFETEGRRWFGQADSPSSGLVRRLVLQSRGEAWYQAAARLRAALPDTTLIEARTAMPDDRSTAA